MISKTKLALLIPAIVPLLLYLTLNHKGDLDYYLYQNDDTSIRNYLISLPLKSFAIINKSISFIILSYSAILFYFTLRFRKYLNKYLLFYLLLFSPFLFFPSKESLTFILVLSIFQLAFKRKWIILILLSVISILRPFYFPLILLIVFQLYFSKLSITFLFFSGSLLFSIFFFLYQEQLIMAFEIFKSYGVDYFENSVSAGTTDFKFIETLKNSSPRVALKSLIWRTYNPSWMLNLNSFTKYFYFGCYLLLFFLGFKFLSLDKKKIFRIHERFLIIVVGTIGILPLVSINAGSAIRYLSPMPLLVFLLWHTRFIQKSLES